MQVESDLDNRWHVLSYSNCDPVLRIIISNCSETGVRAGIYSCRDFRVDSEPRALTQNPSLAFKVMSLGIKKNSWRLGRLRTPSPSDSREQQSYP
jgi:hypothetical protein